MNRRQLFVLSLSGFFCALLQRKRIYQVLTPGLNAWRDRLVVRWQFLSYSQAFNFVRRLRVEGTRITYFFKGCRKELKEFSSVKEAQDFCARIKIV